MKIIKAIGGFGYEYGSIPGNQYHDVDVTITRSIAGKWEVEILETWGNCQGCNNFEEHGRNEVAATADSLDQALDDAKEKADEACIDNEREGYLEEALEEAKTEAQKAIEADAEEGRAAK